MDDYVSDASPSGQASCWGVSSSCGPLFGTVRALPPTNGGEPRFYVDATYAGNGLTVAGQLSIWRWNGSTAVPDLVGGYSYMLDDARGGSTFDGTYLQVPTKERARSFYSTGASVDPAGTWTIHVTPQGVADRRRRWLTPELELVDLLLDSVKSGHAIPHLASPAAYHALTPYVAGLPGMLFHWHMKTQGHDTRISVVIDEFTYTFTLVARGRQLYVLAAEVSRYALPGTA